MTSVRKNKALSAWAQSLPRWKAYLATPNAQLIPAGDLPGHLQHLHCATEGADVSEVKPHAEDHGGRKVICLNPSSHAPPHPEIIQAGEGQLNALLQCAGTRTGGSWLAHSCSPGALALSRPPQKTCWLPFQLCG